MGQYEQMLESLEAQWQIQRQKAEADAQAQLAKLQVQLQQARDKAAAAEQQAEQAQTQTGANAWQTMLIDRNPFGAKAERSHGGGMSEYYQGAAYDAYRSALRYALAQRQKSREETDAYLKDASLTYAMGQTEAERQKQATLAQLEASYQLDRQNVLLQKAAAEQAEAERAARAAAAAKKTSGKKKKTSKKKNYAQSGNQTQAAGQVGGAMDHISTREKELDDAIRGLLR